MEVDADIKKKKYNDSEYTTLCQACLSTNRNLFYLNDYRELFHKIVDSSEKSPEMNYLCWECIALLKKIQLFKEKAIQSQQILQFGLHKKKSPITLSSLSVSQTIVLDSFLEVKQNEEEPIQKDTTEAKIKEEPEFNDGDNFEEYKDDCDFDDSVDNLTDDNKEDAPETSLQNPKKEKKTHKKRYNLIYNEGFSKDKIVKKTVININEVRSWIEREFNSDYYKKLKMKCQLCFSKIRSKIQLKKHYKMFHAKSRLRPFVCDICHRNLKNKQTLVVHMKNHCISRRCAVCDYECYSYDNMQDHIKIHEMIVQCSICEASFTSRRDFFAHLKNIHSHYVCHHCDKKYIQRKVIEKHILRSVGKINRVFYETREYKRHLRAEHKPLEKAVRTEETFCVECNIQFKHQVAFQKHLTKSYAHMREWDVKKEARFCKTCLIQFDNMKDYRKHRRTADVHKSENVPKEEFPCPECPNKYTRKISMLHHYRHVHTKSSNFKCTDCNKSFARKSGLKNHRKFVHEGYALPKNKICPICDRGFACNKILVHHIRTHTGERPFECTYCDAKFAQQTAMKMHVKHIHLKAKRKSN